MGAVCSPLYLNATTDPAEALDEGNSGREEKRGGDTNQSDIVDSRNVGSSLYFCQVVPFKEISGARGCSETLRHLSSQHLSSLPTLCSKPEGVAVRAFQLPRSCPAATQMEKPRWVCTQGFSHNTTILLGSVIAWEAGSVRGMPVSHLSRCWTEMMIHEWQK